MGRERIGANAYPKVIAFYFNKKTVLGNGLVNKRSCFFASARIAQLFF